MPSVRAQQAADDFNRFAESTAIPGRCDVSLSFTTPKLAEAAALWREKVGDNGLSRRSDFTAHTLKPYLPNVIIADGVEESGKRRYRFRLMGTVISDLLGDHTGKFVDEAVISPYRERWFMVLDSANRAACPLRIFGRLEYRQQDYLAMEIMVAPLGTRLGHADAILVLAYASYSASHVFHPLVKNKLSAYDALAS